MTIMSAVVPRKEYTGTGAVTNFAYTWKINTTSELGVYQAGILKTFGTHYTITGIGTAGGDVVFNTAPANGESIIIVSTVQPTQETVWTENDPNPAKNTENAFDKDVRLVQQLNEVDQRGIRFNIHSLFKDIFLPDFTGNALRVWQINVGANGIEYFTATPPVLSPDVLVVPPGVIGWTNGGVITSFNWDENDIISIRRGVNAQSLRIYETYGGGGVDFSRLGISADPGNVQFLIKSVAAGTGVPRRIRIGVHATNLWEFDTAGGFNPIINNISDIATPGSRVRSFYFGGVLDGPEFRATSVLSVSGITVRGTVVPAGHLSGLTLSNNGADATNDIDIAIGEAASDDVTAANKELMSLLAVITKRIDATWVVGTNQGGLDTGVVAPGTYHMWLIKRTDTGVVDVLFSLSATAPTMPANYDKKRRIGSIIRSGSGSILAFIQEGDEFLLVTAILDVDVTNAGIAAVTRTLSVPTGIKVRAIINVYRGAVATNFIVYVSSLDVTDVAPSATAAPLYTVGNSAAITHANQGPIIVRTNTLGQIRSRQDASGAGDTFRIATLGWIERRGRG